MTAPAPISFYVNFHELNDRTRPVYLHELAVNGAKHVVLTSPLLAMMLKDPELPVKLENELKGEGLSFLDSHAPYGPYWDLNCVYDAGRNAQTARLKAAMEIVASFGLDTMTIHMGTDLVAPELSAKTHFDRSCAMLETLLPAAGQLGITICIENGMIRNYRTPHLLAVLEKFRSEHLGFCFDSGHANVMDNGRFHADCFAAKNAALLGEEPEWETMEEKMTGMLPYIVNCHLHDNDGKSDQHNLPGRGNINWSQVTSFLRNAPRLRVIQSEVEAFRNCVAAPELVSAFERIFR